MKWYILSCIVVIFFGCSVNSQIAGKYAVKKNPNCFQLNKDSTFIYEYGSFHAYEYSTGKWRKVDKKTIALSSNIQSIIIPLKVQESNKLNARDSNLLSVNLNVIGGLDAADYKCEVFINDTLYSLISNKYLVSSGLDAEGSKSEVNIKDPLFRYIRCDSLSHIEVRSPIRSIYFQFIQSPRVVTSTVIALHPLVTEKFFPKKGTANNISIGISINDSLFSYRVFNEEILRVKKNRIKLFNSHTDKWEQIPKIPDTTKIFIRY